MPARSILCRRKRSACGRRRAEPNSTRGGNGLATTRCPVCGTLVGLDDALGVIGGELAHAECALVDWLRAPVVGRDHGRPEITLPSGSDRDEAIALLRMLAVLCGDGSEPGP
jgi:hypothetical protein